ncbi:MAG: hypothetical protein ACQESD_01620 [Thermoplasmatota archaeon]
MRRRTYDIRCSECGQKVFKYLKYGDGKIVKCYKNRILEDKSNLENDEVRCPCGNLIGYDKADRIRMKNHSFVTD